jgi:hypothetical protein
MTNEIINCALTSQLTAIEWLDKIDGMYSRSLTSMLTYLSLVLVIVGVIVPLLIAFYQQKKSQIDAKELKGQVDDLIKSARTELNLYLDKAIKDEIQTVEMKVVDIKKDLKKSIDLALGGVFFLQGDIYRSRGDLVVAIENFLTSAESSLPSENDANVQVSLTQIADCLSRMNKTMMDDNNDLIKKLKSFLVNLKKNDSTQRFLTFINNADKQIVDASKRI